MNNRIKCLLASGAGPCTPRQLADAIGWDEGHVKYYIENPTQEMPLCYANAIAKCYDVPLKFVLGLPYKCKRSLQSLPRDIIEDITRAKDSKAYFEHLWRDIYFESDTVAPEGVKGTAFISMCFNTKDYPDLIDIRNAFKSGIEKAGYMPIVIDEKPHNDYIPIEILKEIQRCSFLVIDTTVENYGAYYEAGYAKGLDKRVIICCRKETFDARSDHFNIRQLNHILWSDYNDLSEKLFTRISETL